MEQAIKTVDLSAVNIMTNTSDTHFISERGGKIYRTPFKGEATISKIEKDDLIMFQDAIFEGKGTNKIVSINYEDFLLPITDPDNHPIYTERQDPSSSYTVVPLEKGAIDEKDGDWLDYSTTNPYIRSAMYIPITLNHEYNFSCPSGEILKIRIFLFDNEKRILHDKWNNGLTNYKEIMLNNSFSTDIEGAAFIAFDIKGVGTPDIEFRVDTLLEPFKEYVKINKIKLDDDYDLLVDYSIEHTFHEFELVHKSPRSNISMLTIKAPTSRPLTSTLRLMNAGLKTSQYIDISSIRDKETMDYQGRAEIAIRSFESDTPIPYFAIGFADKINTEVIHKFLIDPDAMPVRLTSKGMQFRLNNYQNNTPGDKELLTVDFKNWNDRINKMYNSLLKHNLITDEITGTETEFKNLNAIHIDYDSDKYPTVADAIDYLMTLDTSQDLTALVNDMGNLSDIVSGIDANNQINDIETNKRIDTLDNTISSYNTRISDMETIVSNCRTSVDNSSDSISTLQQGLANTNTILQQTRSDVNNIMASMTAMSAEEDIATSYPKRQLLSVSNDRVITINTTSSEIMSLAFGISTENKAIIHISTILESELESIVGFYATLDGVNIGKTYRHKLRDDDICTLSMDIPIIHSELLTPGDHIIAIQAYTMNNECTINTNDINMVIDIFEESLL